MKRISKAGEGAPLGATAAKRDDLFDGRQAAPASGPDVTSSQGTILDIESIEWISVKDATPDADTTVMVYAPHSDEPVWLGFYDDVYWFAVTGDGYGDPDEIAAEVVAWAPIPKGPRHE